MTDVPGLALSALGKLYAVLRNLYSVLCTLLQSLNRPRNLN
jgi:hypothetical protein